MLQAPRGTKDILPDEIFKWQYLEKKIRLITEIFDYKEIRTPIFEDTSVFSRSIGTESDIVNKEMYTFLDKGDNSITLRPEMTAALVRAAIQNNLANRGALERLWYYGPFFRYERPQKGRYRQFHQFGAECLSSPNPEADFEVLSMVFALLNSLGIDSYTLNLNTLGNENSRANYVLELEKYLKLHETKLSNDSKRRLQVNPLRILDSKDEDDISIIQSAPKLYNFLDSESQLYFETLLKFLDNAKINYQISDKLVRGLDYYCHTVFEFQSDLLGAQNAFGGGGRYDGLFNQLGGKATPAVGFAIGVERLILLMDSLNIFDKINKLPTTLYIISASEDWRFETQRIANMLRNYKIKVITDIQRKTFKSQMKEANKLLI